LHKQTILTKTKNKFFSIDKKSTLSDLFKYLYYILTFQAHAVQNHPRSRTFFNREQPGKKEIGEDLYYCCPECDFKSQEPNKFQIHALQKHPQSLAFFTGDQQDKSGM
jgi:hypothetical protein